MNQSKIGGTFGSPSSLRGYSYGYCLNVDVKNMNVKLFTPPGIFWVFLPVWGLFVGLFSYLLMKGWL